MARDNFTKPTIEVLAKRVAYHCSNPTCRRLTIGPNEIPDKSTTIGIAAHVTAAASQGPRYDGSLSEEQRSSITNAIWLCSNCATLIDKDANTYTIAVLTNWKEEAEQETKRKMTGQSQGQTQGTPFIEIDLIPSNRGRSNVAYSEKNPIEIHDGKPVRVLVDPPIIFWNLFWNFKFVIYNNSMYPAYNLKITSAGSRHFKQLDTLPKINNIPPLGNLDLKAKLEDFVEGTYLDAEKTTKAVIPRKLQGAKFLISYLDDARNEHESQIEFTESEILSKRVS
jgi:hypothetical protein